MPELTKNWKKVCELKNNLLRLLVATTEDEKILRGLQAGFPELFCDASEEAELCVPFSAIQTKARELGHLWVSVWGYEYVSTFGLEEACSEMGIPNFKLYQVPQGHGDIWAQLLGKRLEKGLTVKYNKQDCTVVAFVANPTEHTVSPGLTTPAIILSLGMEITDSLARYQEQCVSVVLVPSQFIDLDA